MITRIHIAATSSLSLLFAGCVTPHETARVHNSDLVPVSDITGGIKCAFNLALREEKFKKFVRLQGRVVGIQLVLKIVDYSKAGGSAEAAAAGPFVLASSAGTGSILPSFGFSSSRSNTITTIINARLGLQYRSYYGEYCKQWRPEKLDYGFTLWLKSLLESFDKHAQIPPYGIYDNIIYDGEFKLERNMNGSIGYDVIFVNGNINGEANRETVQRIKMTLQAPDNKIPFPQRAYDVMDAYLGGPGRDRSRDSTQLTSDSAGGVGTMQINEENEAQDIPDQPPIDPGELGTFQKIAPAARS